jgi:glycosyltransferase involved in cell wall biosynthesis
MRILYLSADRGISLEKHNGATAHFRSLVRAFQSLGHELLVLTPCGAGEKALGAPIIRIPASAMLDDLMKEADAPIPQAERHARRHRERVAHALGHVWNNVLVEQELERQIDRFAPDFVFELYAPFGVAGVLTCNRLDVPHVLNVHAPLAWEGATYRSQALQDAAVALEDVAFRRAQRIVANSRQMRDQLVDAGVDGSKIEVVINGVDLDLFRPDAGARDVPPEGAVVVGFSGSLKAWHGVDVLAAAFRTAAAADERLHLLVVGDGPLRKELRRLAAEIPGRVTLTGAVPLEQVPALVCAMDMSVAPYPPLDPFYFSPLKILDAMACGVCNVASEIGQVSELLRDGETGVLVRPGDVDHLASAILRLAGDAPARERMGRAALIEARRNHAWKSRAADIVSIAMRDVSVAGAA